MAEAVQHKETTPTRLKKPPHPKFRTREEVENFPGFQPRKYFLPDDYELGLADYVVPGKVLKCCLILPNGHPCRTEHEFGYLVRLKDGTVTIIGNCCVFDKVPRGHHIQEDVLRIRREQTRDQQLKTIRSLVAKFDERFTVFERYLSLVDYVREYVQRFRQIFGEGVYSEIVRKARSNGIYMSVNIQIHREEALPNNKTKTHTSKVTQTVGSLSGLDLFQENRIRNLRSRIVDTRDFYKNFSLGAISDDATERQLTTIIAQFNRFNDFEYEVRELLLARQSFDGNDFSKFFCLIDDATAHVSVVRAAHTFRGTNISEDEARRQIGEFEAHLTKEYKSATVSYIPFNQYRR